jgi:hypothetical protein
MRNLNSKFLPFLLVAALLTLFLPITVVAETLVVESRTNIIALEQHRFELQPAVRGAVTFAAEDCLIDQTRTIHYYDVQGNLFAVELINLEAFADGMVLNSATTYTLSDSMIVTVAVQGVGGSDTANFSIAGTFTQASGGNPSWVSVIATRTSGSNMVIPGTIGQGTSRMILFTNANNHSNSAYSASVTYVFGENHNNVATVTTSLATIGAGSSIARG